jgi:hypothetical protein
MKLALVRGGRLGYEIYSSAEVDRACLRKIGRILSERGSRGSLPVSTAEC